MKNNNQKIIKVALVDDHILLRNALGALIDGFQNFKVVHLCSNGLDLIENLTHSAIPDVIILDLNMPHMNGFDTAEWLKKNHPSIHVLMLTVHDSDLILIRLLKFGVKGFLRKDIHPDELKHAIESVVQNGYYYSNNSTGKLISLFRTSNDGTNGLQKAILSDQEISFLSFACSDMTYKEVAQKMGLNPRSVDTLRDQLFVKLDVKSRVGLVMVALKNGVVTF